MHTTAAIRRKPLLDYMCLHHRHFFLNKIYMKASFDNPIVWALNIPANPSNKTNVLLWIKYWSGNVSYLQHLSPVISDVFPLCGICYRTVQSQLKPSLPTTVVETFSMLFPTPISAVPFQSVKHQGGWVRDLFSEMQKNRVFCCMNFAPMDKQTRKHLFCPSCHNHLVCREVQ